MIELGETIRARIRARIEENRAILERIVGAASPCRVLEADGGWYAVLQVPAVLPEEDLVLSLLPDPGMFSEALRRILSRVERG